MRTISDIPLSLIIGGICNCLGRVSCASCCICLGYQFLVATPSASSYWSFDSMYSLFFSQVTQGALGLSVGWQMRLTITFSTSASQGLPVFFPCAWTSSQLLSQVKISSSCSITWLASRCRRILDSLIASSLLSPNSNLATATGPSF